MPCQITSSQNPKIKWLLQLQQKSSARREEGLFVVEGQRELMHCVNNGYRIHSIFFCPEILGAESHPGLQRSNSDVDAYALLEQADTLYEVSGKVYEKMAYRGGTEGVIAVVRTREQRLSQLEDGLQVGASRGVGESHAPFYVVLEGVEKPGNLGAILRSADAAAADAVIICDPRTDLYNPNLIRSSIGAVFTVPCVTCTSAECIAFLKRNGIQILTAQLQDSLPYYSMDMRRATAIVMGTEAVGLTQPWREAADAHIRIPMCGKLDSLNVSVSTAILMFEVVRQRSADTLHGFPSSVESS